MSMDPRHPDFKKYDWNNPRVRDNPRGASVSARAYRDPRDFEYLRKPKQAEPQVADEDENRPENQYHPRQSFEDEDPRYNDRSGYPDHGGYSRGPQGADRYPMDERGAPFDYNSQSYQDHRRDCDGGRGDETYPYDDRRAYDDKREYDYRYSPDEVVVEDMDSRLRREALAPPAGKPSQRFDERDLPPKIGSGYTTTGNGSYIHIADPKVCWWLFCVNFENEF